MTEQSIKLPTMHCPTDPVSDCKASHCPSAPQDLRILLAENDMYNVGLIKGYCQILKCSLVHVNNIAGAKRQFLEMDPNLVIFDIRFAQAKGWKTLYDGITRKKIPIFAIGQLDDASSLPQKLALHVDNCLMNPVDIGQFELHLQSLFNFPANNSRERRNDKRRSGGDRRDHSNGRRELEQNSVTENSISESMFARGSFKINDRSKTVSINGKSQNLSPREYEIVSLLSSDAGRVFSIDEIIAYIWPNDNHASNSDVHQYIHLLRNKIEIDPKKPRWILTAKGFGYKLAIPDTPA